MKTTNWLEFIASIYIIVGLFVGLRAVDHAVKDRLSNEHYRLLSNYVFALILMLGFVVTAVAWPYELYLHRQADDSE